MYVEYRKIYNSQNQRVMCFIISSYFYNKRWLICVLVVNFLILRLNIDATNFGTFLPFYTVQNATISKVNGVYKCTSASICNHIVFSDYRLSTTFIVVNGSLQKRWFITESTGSKKDVYLYGSVEYSSHPLKLKQWKRMIQGGLHEPDLKMKELKIAIQCENLRRDKQDFDFSIGAEMLWVLLMFRRVSTYQNNKIFINLCTDILVFNLLNDIKLFPSNSQTLIAFAICELNLQRGFYSESFDCYERTLATDFSNSSESLTLYWSELCSKYMNRSTYSGNTFSKRVPFFPLPVWLVDNRNMQYLHFSSSLITPLDPIQCIFGYFQVDNESKRHQHQAMCIWLAINTRSSFELLVSDMNPFAALDMVKMIMLNRMEMVSYEHLQAMQIILSVFLGNIGNVVKYGNPMHSISLSNDRFDGNIPAIFVNESSIVFMCSTLLTMRKEVVGQHIFDDPFHQILYATCFQLSFHFGKSLSNIKPNATIISDSNLIDFSASQITSLMGLGLVEVAVLNFYYPVATLFNRYVSTNLELYQPVEFEQVLFDLAQEVGITINLAERDALLNSDNIRAALLLHRLVSFIFDHPDGNALVVHYQGLLGHFVQLALQVSSPTLLDTTVAVSQSAHIWMKEALMLRLWSIVLLDRLIALCGVLESRQYCSIPNPHYTVGARGLFLLAYQGIGLLSPLLIGNDNSFDQRDLLLDSIVPFKYFQLIKLVAEDYPWDIVNGTAMIISSNNPVKVKVAFLSFFFRRHSVGRLLAKVIAQLDRDVFNVWIVCQSKSRSSVDSTLAEDDIYDYLQNSIDPHHWLYLSEDLAGAAAAIQDLSLDVLVFGDLFMDSFVTHLAMFRTAPVQICFWGHPHTSGFPSMDYFITSDEFEPNAVLHSRSHHFSEQLVRFDSLSFQMFSSEKLSGIDTFGKYTGGWCGCSKEIEPSFHADTWLLERERAIDWILMNGFDLYDLPLSAAVFIEPWTTKLCTMESVSNKSSGAQCADTLYNIHLYGSLQSLMKMHPLFDRAIVGILRADPSAVILLLRNSRQLAWHRRLRNRLLTALKQTNESHLVERVVFLNQRPHAEYMQLLCALDVSLDPFPFGGGVTLCDSFGGSCSNSRGSCGIPFVTSGELQSVHRIGVGLAKAFNSSYTARNSDESLVMQQSLENQSESESNSAYQLSKRLDSYVRAYVEEAVELRQRKQMCTSSDRTTENSEHFIIHQSLKAVQEWERFIVQVNKYRYY